MLLKEAMTDSSIHPVLTAAMLREQLGGTYAVRFQGIETHAVKLPDTVQVENRGLGAASRRHAGRGRHWRRTVRTKLLKTRGCEQRSESKFCHAADFADEWFNEGERAFIPYYERTGAATPSATTHGPSCTMISSAGGQRWYYNISKPTKNGTTPV